LPLNHKAALASGWLLTKCLRRRLREAWRFSWDFLGIRLDARETLRRFSKIAQYRGIEIRYGRLSLEQ
jgi:hypothetical protein